VRIIDLFGLTEDEAKEQYPGLYQHVLIHVKPERDQNNRDTYRLNWWIFGEPRRDFRPALKDLPRYIATVETSKHRFFTFLDQDILPDNRLICFAVSDAFHLGVLSSIVHVSWALAVGGRLEDRPVYNKSVCFDPFPFPALEEGELKQRIRDLGERLDAHRKRQQEQHPGLTLTGIYNVLEKLRAGEILNAKEKQIHDQGLVTLLRQIHDELDEAVLEAYGWSDLAGTALRSGPANESPLNGADAPEDKDSPILTPCAGPPGCRSLPSDELLSRLVTLNHERAAEEKRGLIRWLRPDYQNPNAAAPQPIQATLAGTEASSSQSKIQNPQSSIGNLSWPAKLPDQVTLIRQLLTTDPTATPEQLSARFGRKNPKRTEQIEGILETLKGLGRM
jgi:hypothetical protein